MTRFAVLNYSSDTASINVRGEKWAMENNLKIFSLTFTMEMSLELWRFLQLHDHGLESFRVHSRTTMKPFGLLFCIVLVLDQPVRLSLENYLHHSPTISMVGNLRRNSREGLTIIEFFLGSRWIVTVFTFWWIVSFSNGSREIRTTSFCSFPSAVLMFQKKTNATSSYLALQISEFYDFLNLIHLHGSARNSLLFAG